MEKMQPGGAGQQSEWQSWLSEYSWCADMPFVLSAGEGVFLLSWGMLSRVTLVDLLVL